MSAQAALGRSIVRVVILASCWLPVEHILCAGTVVGDWITCSVATDTCSGSGFVCCIGPGDAGTGKTTCRWGGSGTDCVVTKAPTTTPVHYGGHYNLGNTGSTMTIMTKRPYAVYEPYMSAFLATYPDNTVVSFVQQSTDAEIQSDTASYTSVQRGPDVLQWYSGGSGSNKLIANGNFRNLDAMFKKYNLYEQLAPSMLKGGQDANGHPYIVPTDAYHWAMYYRPSVWRRYNVRPPKTWADWMAACDTFLAAGITPIYLGNYEGWPAISNFDYFDMRIRGPVAHMALLDGQQPWTSPDVYDVFMEWRRILDKYTRYQDIVNGWSTPDPVFLGTAAMAFCGDFVRWGAPAGFNMSDFDFFQFPIFDPGLAVGENAPGDGLVISATSQNPALAEAWLAYLVSTNVSIARVKAGDIRIPSNVNAFSSISDPLTLKGANMLRNADYITGVGDREVLADFKAVYTPELVKFLTYNYTGDAIRAMLQRLETARVQVYLHQAAPPDITASSSTTTTTPTDLISTKPVWVNLTTVTGGTKIYFTLDGSEPSDAAELYQGPILIAQSGRITLKAVTVGDALMIRSSKVSQQTFVLNLDPPPTFLGISVGVAGFSIALAIIGIVYALVLMALVQRYSREPILKAAAPRFLQIMLVGAIIALTCGVWMALDVSVGVPYSLSSTSCMVNIWAISIGWALMFGALFAKTYRVSSLFQAFEANNLTVKAVSDETLFRIVGLMTSLELLILVAWTVINPLTLASVDLGNAVSRHQCVSSGGSSVWAFATVSIVAKFAVLIAGIALCIQTRNVHDAFNGASDLVILPPADQARLTTAVDMTESKKIAFSIYNIATFGTGAFVISFLINEQDVALAVRAVGLFLSVVITITGVVLTKIYIIFYDKEMNNDKAWDLLSVSKRKAKGATTTSALPLTSGINRVTPATPVVPSALASGSTTAGLR
ncbi:G-protein coupled receptors family 3 profile domain-containing protein [Plasmodiophora brassicae]|uniref:G-protein coupled receptors family 3 profile domain-containing protein n=1 Tax=Plasmodiophora brassicae TaxID=37360 RepID=A0A0G4J0T2_PLABS|nr:hypothetical protein PBRA_008472 [Plasmodiophora brassicae]